MKVMRAFDVEERRSEEGHEFVIHNPVTGQVIVYGHKSGRRDDVLATMRDHGWQVVVEVADEKEIRQPVVLRADLPPLVNAQGWQLGDPL